MSSESQPLPIGSASGVEAQSVIAVRDTLTFPALPSGETSSLIRLQLVDVKPNGTLEILATNAYLQSDPKVHPQDYSDLGALRNAKDDWVELKVAKIVEERINGVSTGTWQILILMPSVMISLRNAYMIIILFSNNK